MSGCSLRYFTTLISLGIKGVGIAEKYFFWLFTRPHVTKFLESCMNLWVKTPHGKSPPCHVWWPLSSASGNVKYSIFPETSRNLDMERSYNIMNVITVSRLVATGIVVVEICFSFVTWSSKTTWIKVYRSIWIGAPQGNSPTCQIWWP